MKAYKVTLLIVDHDGVGADGIKDVIENQRYPNRCIDPGVMQIECADIGEWRDEHPLNFRAQRAAEFARLFPVALGKP